MPIPTVTPTLVKGQSVMSDTNTAIAKREPSSLSVIATPDEFRGYLQAHDDSRFIVLTPQADFGALPPQWTIVPSIVQINPNPDGGEVYRDGLFCKNDEVSLTKIGLRKIARGAGISWKTQRLDSGTVQYYWSMSASIEYRGFDGQMKTAEASYEWDLRDGSARVISGKGMSANELNRARLNGLRRCEAGAINAAVREYGLKQKYSSRELQKPFVCFNLVFQPDMSDPTVKAMVTQAALTGAATLYGNMPALPAARINHAAGDIIDADDDDEQPVTETAQPAGPKPTPPATAVPLESEPEPEKPAREYAITAVMKQGAGYYLTTKETADTPLRTDDLSLAKAAKAAMEGKATVHLELETRGGETFVLELQAVAEKL